MNIHGFTLLYILQLIGAALIFGKMGVAEWKALIPVYNEYILYKKVWKVEFFWLHLAAKVILALAFGVTILLSLFDGNEFMILELLVTTVFVSAVTVVIHINLLHKLAVSFGHGGLFTTCMFFCSGVFMMYLGAGKDTYHCQLAC